jgi:hypothetical protein
MERLPARLDDLIDYVRSRAPEGDTLDHLAEAVLASAQLGELADHLVGHFVDQARRSGASWAEIGQALGVSKQAAQKRFVPRASGVGAAETSGSVTSSFSRFTQRARTVLERAHDSAHQAGHPHVRPEHILVALIDERDALAARALDAHGVPLDALRAAAAARLGPPEPGVTVSPAAHVPFSPQAKKLFELTVREALRLDHNYVGTEHVLLGLLLEEAGPVAHLLAEHGADHDRLERWIVASLPP